jgi:hypothetical protein
VLLDERWIPARLRNARFFSLAELNGAITTLTADLNPLIMRSFGARRADLFATLDAPALRGLPERPYTFALWKRCPALRMAAQRRTRASCSRAAERGKTPRSPVRDPLDTRFREELRQRLARRIGRCRFHPKLPFRAATPTNRPPPMAAMVVAGRLVAST